MITVLTRVCKSGNIDLCFFLVNNTKLRSFFNTGTVFLHASQTNCTDTECFNRYGTVPILIVWAVTVLKVK